MISDFISSAIVHEPTVIAPPDKLPLDILDARSSVRVLSSGHDDELTLLLEAAADYIQGRLGVTLITTGYRWYAPQWFVEHHRDGEVRITLPSGPHQSVDKISYYDTDDTLQENDASWIASYFTFITRKNLPAVLVSKRNVILPSLSERDDAVSIEFTAGYGDTHDEVPAGIKHAIRLLIAHWFEHPEAVVTGTISATIELSFRSLMNRYKTGYYCDV